MLLTHFEDLRRGRSVRALCSVRARSGTLQRDARCQALLYVAGATYQGYSYSGKLFVQLRDVRTRCERLEDH